MGCRVTQKNLRHILQTRCPEKAVIRKPQDVPLELAEASLWMLDVSAVQKLRNVKSALKDFKETHFDGVNVKVKREEEELQLAQHALALDPLNQEAI
ncbi:hypothetical protein Ancab_019701 [Ancistrocladus abbreviatus]